MLAYTEPTVKNSICTWVMEGCHIPTNINRVEWWENYGIKNTKEAITRFRNDRTQGMKNALRSKLSVEES